MKSKQNPKNSSDQRKTMITKPGRRPDTNSANFDALLALAGSGRDIWADEHADEYVDRLREGWE